MIVVWPGHKNFEFWFCKAFLRAVLTFDFEKISSEQNFEFWFWKAFLRVGRFLRILNFDFEKLSSEQGAFGGGGAANGGGEGVEGEYVEVESDQEENQFE